jgi:hypothetical protein
MAMIWPYLGFSTFTFSSLGIKPKESPMYTIKTLEKKSVRKLSSQYWFRPLPVARALGKGLAMVKRFWVSLGLLAFFGMSFTAATIPVSPASAAACFSTFTNKTTVNGLGDDYVFGVYADGLKVYAATAGGLSISINGGTSFDNRTVANATLANDNVNGVYVVGSTIYAATGGAGGLSISRNGGTSFVNGTAVVVNGVYADGINVYAATAGGLSISINGGTSFENRTTVNGLGSNDVYGVYADGLNVYAATAGGLSISTDGGTSFDNRTVANATLGNNIVLGVYVDGSTIYAATAGGLSISTDGGDNFTNKTTVNGLGSNVVQGVYVDGSKVYAATAGGLSISADCASSSPPPTEGGAPAQVKAPTLAETGPDLSLVLVGSGVSTLFLVVGAAAILAARRKLAAS